MRIESVRLRGFMPFLDDQVVVLPPGPVAIIGTHDGDRRRSNRAGKTSLLEAVHWCLWGKHRKRTLDALTHTRADEVLVEVHLGDVRVTRRRKRGESEVLEVMVGAETLRGAVAQQDLERRFGMGLAEYDATVRFPQGETAAFIRSTPSQRLVTASAWLRLERWGEARKAQTKIVTEADRKLGEARAALAAGAEHALSDEEIVEVRDAIARATAECEVAALDVDAAERDFELSLGARKVVKDFERLDQLRARAAEQKRAAQGRAVAKLEIDASLEASKSASREFRNATDRRDQIRRIATSGFGGRCPVMCAACPVPGEVENAISSSSALLDEASAAAMAFGKRAREIDEGLHAAQRRMEIAASADRAYRQTLEDGRALAATLTGVDRDLTARVADRVEEHRAARDVAAAKLTAVRAEVARLTEKARSADGARDLQAKRADAVAGAERALAGHRLAFRALSQVPSEIVASELVRLEADANALLADLGVSLSFSWGRETAEKAASCPDCGHGYRGGRDKACPDCGAPRGRKVADELELLVDDGSGALEDADVASGGTKALVGCAVRLAASAMLRRDRDCPVGWALVDEPFGEMDSGNRDAMARVFVGMLGAVGFEQALVISHDPALLAAMPSRVVIDRRGDGSFVRVES